QGRVRNLARRSGRGDILRVLLGGDRQARVRVISDEEAGYLVDHLIQSGRASEVWKLVFELPFAWGLAAASKLDAAGWVADRPDDKAMQERLVAALRGNVLSHVDGLAAHLPLAIHRADARVKGNANSVSFAPDSMNLAIGTNARKVGVW